MLNKILDSCYFVVNNAKNVKINYNKLDSFISTVNCNDLKHWLSSNPYGLLDFSISEIVNFLLMFESIDYSFWGEPKWTIETEIGSKDGADALLYCLLEFFKKEKNMDFSNISFERFKNILKGNVEIPLIEDRYNTLVNISNVVNQKMKGNFYEFIKDFTSDTEIFEVIINYFPQFKDERTYEGKKIYFYKLAQLLTSDILHIRELKERINVDYSHLLGCADYKIPQTMRALEIIEYNKELSDIIDNKREIILFSNYETEIRATMLVVINYIKNKLQHANAIDINDYFFMASKKAKIKVKPYHLCRNTNY